VREHAYASAYWPQFLSSAFSKPATDSIHIDFFRLSTRPRYGFGQLTETLSLSWPSTNCCARTERTLCRRRIASWCLP